MFTRFNPQSRTIFLDPNSIDEYTSIKDEKINVILSPSLYWIKKVSLPLKYTRDVKKLLPSLFEDILPKGTYSYSVYKQEEEFYIFAYEDKVILDTITKANISISNIASVHFAQSEMQNIEDAVKINETQSIYVKNGIVVLVLSCWTKESVELNLSEMTLSNHKVVLQQYAHIVENSSLYKIGAVLVLFSILVFGEYLIILNKSSQISDLNERIFSKYGLKPTILQNKSMLGKYKTIHERQIKLRQYISSILSLKLQGVVKLSKMSLKDKSLNVEFTNISQTTLLDLKKNLELKKIKFTTHVKDKTIYLEMFL